MKSTYFLLWILCIIGSASLIPYVQHLNIPVPWEFYIVQSALIYGLVCLLCYFLVPRTDLNPFKRPKIFLGICAGLTVGFAIYLLDLFVFNRIEGCPPGWMGFLASIYGAINEEVLLRLFLFTLIYFLLCKIVKGFRTGLLHVTNFIVALSFGLGHLPALYHLVDPTSFEMARVLVLNGMAGLVFGWLYWSRGIWTAMIAHFAADIVIHVMIV